MRASDTQRVVRALEVIEATGRPLAEWQKIKGKPVITRESAELLVVTRPRQDLYDRSSRRFDDMLRAGALEEGRCCAGDATSRWFAGVAGIGAAPLIAHLEGEATIEAAVEEAKRDTRHYIRRQNTWIMEE